MVALVDRVVQWERVVMIADLPEYEWSKFVKYLWSEKAHSTVDMATQQCQWTLWGSL